MIEIKESAATRGSDGIPYRNLWRLILKTIISVYSNWGGFLEFAKIDFLEFAEIDFQGGEIKQELQQALSLLT